MASSGSCWPNRSTVHGRFCRGIRTIVNDRGGRHFVHLASASPRRGELLRQLGLSFDVMPANVDESRHPGEAPGAYVVRLALEKARAAWNALPRPDAP
ncbi:MAG: Maf family protein, partial [Gammaproteobacteria bacterium]